MKKKYLIFFIILSFICVKIFSYQPAEQGLLFSDEYKKTLKKVRPVSGSRFDVQKRMNIVREKRNDDLDSLVFLVNGLSQFLYLSITSFKPMVIKIFSDKNPFQIVYQKLADKFKDKVVFVSLNTSTNLPLVQIFLLILRSKGIAFSQEKNKFPLFLFCKKDFVVFHNRSISFKKDGLKLVSNGQTSDENELEMAIEKVLSQENGNKSSQRAASFLRKTRSELQKLKKWLKTKFFRKK